MMAAKKILAISAGSLFPTVMASQDRILKMIVRLARDHSVEMASIVRTSSEIDLSRKNLKPYDIRFHPVRALNFNRTRLAKKILGAQWYAHYLLFGLSSRYYYWGHRIIIRQLREIIRSGHYDIVQVSGWHSGDVFGQVPEGIYSAIDTNDVLFEKKEKEYSARFGNRIPFFKRRELSRDRAEEIRIARMADIVISISEHDKQIFETLAPQSRHILVPTGQDIDFYKNYPRPEEPGDLMVVFYGFLNNPENTLALLRLYQRILPLIRERIPGVRLLVLGASPPPEIVKWVEDGRTQVTGFVDDVRPYLARASVMILPLEIAGGFRSRVVEAMAMGIPVLGTSNALQSLGFREGREGYIAEDDRALAEKSTELLKNAALRRTVGEAGRRFVEERYGIEATYGGLSEYYGSLP
jgi:glycosyltransferase involved in cell wall biosynthesis